MKETKAPHVLFVEKNLITQAFYLYSFVNFGDHRLTIVNSHAEACGVIQSHHDEIVLVLTDSSLFDGNTGLSVVQEALQQGVPNVILKSTDPQMISESEKRFGDYERFKSILVTSNLLEVSKKIQQILKSK